VAEPGLSGPVLSRPARAVLEGWLDRLGSALHAPERMRARIVDELRDGLCSAAERHLAAGTDAVAAARAATAEFGDPLTVAASFRDELTAHRARRIALVLIASGPLVGLAWLAALVPPLWPPRPADLLGAHPLYLVALAVSVPAALLAIAATGRPGRRLQDHPAHAARAAAVAASACAAGDVLLLTTLATAVVTPAWPVTLLAASTSTVRLGLACRAARQCLAGPPVRIANIP
jgi:hypothetical protein